jgi:putative endonuclease
MYTVYVLYSRKFDKIYIGSTSNLEQRFLSHNELSNKGWTKKFRPWEIIYKEEYDLKSDALKREKELKSFKGREFIRKQIIASNS